MNLASDWRMLHAAPRSAPGTLLFHTWSEARALWDTIIRHVPRISHLVLMPDHLHARVTPDQWRALQRAMAAWAQARNRRRGAWGPVWRHGHRPTLIGDPQKDRRTRRYILLNPCRAGLVDDPLEWPFSTLRDAVGLAIPLVRPVVSDRWRLMSYLAQDDHVRAGMDELPVAQVGAPALAQIEAAVSALTRTPMEGLYRRGPVRTLFVQSARALSGASTRDIARLIGLSPRSIVRTPASIDANVQRVSTVAGSPRFTALADDDLLRSPTWRRYRGRR